MKEKTLKLKCNVNLLNKKVIKYVDDELDKLCNHTNIKPQQFYKALYHCDSDICSFKALNLISKLIVKDVLQLVYSQLTVAN